MVSAIGPGAASYAPPDDGLVERLLHLVAWKPVCSTPESGWWLARRTHFLRPEPSRPPRVVLRLLRRVRSRTSPPSRYSVLIRLARQGSTISNAHPRIGAPKARLSHLYFELHPPL